MSQNWFYRSGLEIWRLRYLEWHVEVHKAHKISKLSEDKKDDATLLNAFIEVLCVPLQVGYLDLHNSNTER